MNPSFTIDSSGNIYDPSTVSAAASVHVSDPEICELLGVGKRPSAGIRISDWTARQISAWWCGMNIIANTIACLPLKMYRRDEAEDSRSKVGKEHPVGRLLRRPPNRLMTWFTFKQTLQAQIVARGNGYAEIERNGKLEPIALWPIQSNRVQPRIKNGYELVYMVDGMEVDAEDVLHISGVGSDGIEGYNTINVAQESLSGVAGAERHANTFWGNSCRPGGFLKTAKSLTDEARETLRSDFQNLTTGENTHKVILLQDGLEFMASQTSMKDSQFIDNRRFGIEEIARWLNLPPHILKDLSRSTNNNIEQQTRDLYDISMLPWTTNWEEALARRLLTEDEQGEYYFKFNADYFLRASTLERYDAHAKAVGGPFKTPNEVRRDEDMDPLPGGDDLLSPMNMAPAGSASADQPRGLLGPNGKPMWQYLRDSR